MSLKEKAISLLKEFKGDNYAFGLGAFDKLGDFAASYGKRATVIISGFGKAWGEPLRKQTQEVLDKAGVEIIDGFQKGPAPNAPIEDVKRMADLINTQKPDVVLAVGGGSLIDGVKAAVALSVLGDKYPDIESYFGAGVTGDLLEKEGRKMLPIVAAELASGSAAHLTKYSNITNMETKQKKLIIDMAVVPPKAVFDYKMTTSMSKDFTNDGALDGIAHCLEVLYGAKGDVLEKVRPISLTGIELIVQNAKKAVEDPENLEAREMLGLGTDLGGNAIMVGGTNGAHLNSFSMVDILSHGRACAMMNPYYTVFFAPAIQDQLKDLAAIYKNAGYLSTDISSLSGTDLGKAVAEAMLKLSEDIGFPTKLTDVDGFSDEHIKRCLSAAKNPQLASKLQNMPVALTAETVDEYMGGVLEAAKGGDFSKIKSM